MSSILQHNKVIDIRSKPTFVPPRTPSNSLVYLVACHVSCHMLGLLRLYACLLYNYCALSTHLFLSVACMLVSCLCLCMYTHEARTHGARAWSPRHKQKGRECKHVNMSRTAMFSWFRGLASPIGLCTLLKPPSFPPPPPKLRANHVDHSRGASNGPCGRGSPF